MTDDAKLRRAWATLPTRGEHPGEAAWERFSCAELSDDERTRLAEHVVTCPPCVDTFRTVNTLVAEAGRLDPSLPRPSAAPAPPRRRWAWWPSLGLATCTAALALSLVLREAPPPETLRGPTGEVVELVLPTPGTVKWGPVTAATAYRARVFTADGRPLWVGATATETAASWPQAATAAPGTYYWSIEALRGEQVIARSRLQAFRLPR